MPKKFLKRFERLENIPANNPLKENVNISKRFDRLEIAEKKIEVTITDKIKWQEKAPVEITYDIICKNCGAQNPAGSSTCILCKHSLRLQEDEPHRLGEGALKRCLACGATSLEDRLNCWVCGKEFLAGPQRNVALNSDNVITLNIDGKEYKSTDKSLPLEIRLLMERIRRQGYNKEIIEDWVKKRNLSAETENKELSRQAVVLRRELRARKLGLISMLILGVIVTFIIVYRFYLQNLWLERASEGIKELMK